MDELLNDLLLAMEEGIFSDTKELQDIIDSEGLEVLYESADKEAFPSMEEYLSYFGSLKKKEEVVLSGTDPKETTDVVTPVPTAVDGSLDSSGGTPDIVADPIIPENKVDVVDPNIVQDEDILAGIDNPNIDGDEVIDGGAKKLYEVNEDGTITDLVSEGKKEDTTWLEESWLGKASDWAFDDVPILGVLSADFWGDMYRAIGNGYTKGQSVDDAIMLFAKGKNISDEDLADYIAAVKKGDSVVQSDEMKSFSKIYEENGGGILGFILGFGSNLSIAPELLIDSLASMFNPASAVAAGSGAAVGAGTGAALTAAGGPLALFGAGAGAMGGAMGGASAALEFGMSYTEFMREEIELKGGEFNTEGIRDVLKDDEALQRIRNKAAIRGLAIGMIDAMTAGLSSKVVKTGKALAKGTAKSLALGGKGVVSRPMVNKGIQISKGLGVEIVGGSTGEATARLLAGQEMDVAEIGLEGFAGAGNAPISIGFGIYKTPRYKIGNESVTKEYILATIGTATPAQIGAMNIEIKNDTKLQSVITDLKAMSQFEVEIEETTTVPKGPDRDALIKLEIEKSKLPDSRSESTRLKRQKIDEQIKIIVDRYDGAISESVSIERDGNTFTENIVVTRQEAIDQLVLDGGENPSDKAVSDMQKALMEKAKSSDQHAENAIKIEQDAIAEAEASVTKEDVFAEIKGDVYTDQEFENVKNILIKKKVDAIQKSSTTEVDVRQQASDGQGVGDINSEQEVTEEGKTNNEQEGVQTTEVEETEVGLTPNAPYSRGTAETYSSETMEVTMISTRPDGQPANTKKEGDVFRVRVSKLGTDGYMRTNNQMTQSFETVEEARNYANKFISKDTKKEVKRFKTKRVKQPGRYRVPGSRTVDVEVDADGNVYAVNRKSGRKLKTTPPKVQEFILKNVIDVNEGTRLELDTETNLTEAQYSQEIADNSNNIKEVAETIDAEKKRLKEQTKSEKESEADPLNIASLAGKITEEQFVNASSAGDVTTNIRRFWFSNPQEKVFSKETGGGLDTLVMDLDGYTQENESEYIQKVVDFIIKNETGKVEIATVKSPALVDLEIKFQELTGLKATPKNVETVLSIDPNREPNAAIKEKSDTSDKKAASEPGVFGKKRGPSAKRITQGKPKKIVVDESAALKDQIRLEARAAKGSVKAFRKAQKVLSDKILALEAQGEVNARTARLMIKKILRTDFTTDKGAKALETYLTKVMSDATIGNKLKIIKNKSIQAIKNIKSGKIGANNNALIDVLKKLNSLPQSSIPLDKIDALLSLMETYGARKKELDIQDIGGDTKIALDILNDVNQDAEIQAEPAPVEEKEKKVKEYDLKGTIASIQDTKADLDRIGDPNSRQIAKELDELTTQDIQGLIDLKKGEPDYSVLETLKAVKQSLSQGVLSNAANQILLEVKSNRASKPVSKVIIKRVTKAGIIKSFKNISSSIKLAITSKSPSGKNLLLDKIRSSVATHIDNAFGNLNSTTIFDNTLGKLAKTYESFKVTVDKGFAKIEGAERILEYDGKGFIRRNLRVGNSANKIVAKKYKIRLLQLQREHQLNTIDGVPSKKSPSAIDFLNVTIADIKNGSVTALGVPDLRILEKLKQQFEVDGEISLDKLEKSLTNGEKKALSLYDEVNNGLGELASFTSAVLRGDRVELINGYSHRVVLSSQTNQELELKSNAFSNPSTKSGTLVQRTNGAKPISFDPSLSAQRGLQETNMDYIMTNPVREVMMTINKVIAQVTENGGTKDQIQAAQALKKVTEEILKVTFGETMRNIGVAEAALQKVKKTAYQAILGSVDRMVAEFLSNTAMIASNPKAALIGFKEFAGLSYLGAKKGTDILNNLGSAETSKLYDPKNMTSRFAEMGSFTQVTPKSQTAKGHVANIMGILLRLGPKQTASAVDNIASAIISAPDLAISRPMWYGTFALSFKNQTGVSLTKQDMIEIGEGTSVYLTDEYKTARTKAVETADRSAVAISTSKNPFKGVVKNQSRSSGVGSSDKTNAYRAANKFMANFSLFEYATARNAIGALQRSGEMSKFQALGVLTGIGARMTMYPLLYSLLTSWSDDELFGAEADEDESSIEDMIIRQTFGTMLTLLTRKSMGNIPNLAPSLLIEQFNEHMLEDFRTGDYDPYKHSIVYSQLNPDDLGEKGFVNTAVKIMSGPFGPIIKTLERATVLSSRSINNKTKESRKKNLDELTNRMVLEGLGNAGLIPFYKDVRRIVIKQQFEGAMKKRKSDAAEKKEKEYMKYLKENDPEEYRIKLREQLNDPFKQEVFQNDDGFSADDWD